MAMRLVGARGCCQMKPKFSSRCPRACARIGPVEILPLGAVALVSVSAAVVFREADRRHDALSPSP
jgi:hypothetical protein